MPNTPRDQQRGRTHRITDDPLISATVKSILLVVSFVAASLIVMGPIILLNLEQAQQHPQWPMLLRSLGFFVLVLLVAVLILLTMASAAARPEERDD